MCQYDMAALADQYDLIEKAGGQVYVALQSSMETIEAFLETKTYPFTIISDEPGKLYQALGIDVAASNNQLSSSQSRSKVEKAVACGMVHG